MRSGAENGRFVRVPLPILLPALLLAGALPLAATEIGKPAPGFAGVKDEAGKPHGLADHKGQVLVLVVWSSRCNHSKQYAARLVALARRYRPKDKKKRPQVAFLGVAPNRHETPKAVAKATAAAAAVIAAAAAAAPAMAAPWPPLRLAPRHPIQKRHILLA